jgi:hypothetical protein
VFHKNVSAKRIGPISRCRDLIPREAQSEVSKKFEISGRHTIKAALECAFLDSLLATPGATFAW